MYVLTLGSHVITGWPVTVMVFLMLFLAVTGLLFVIGVMVAMVRERAVGGAVLTVRSKGVVFFAEHENTDPGTWRCLVGTVATDAGEISRATFVAIGDVAGIEARRRVTNALREVTDIKD